MLRFRDIPRALVIRSQNPEVNSDPLSDTMLLGSPWGRTTCFINSSASLFGSIVSLQATKCPILVSRSITTHKALHPSVFGNPVMKSMDIESHGRCGGASGFSSPNGACRIGLIRLQVSQ